MARVALVTGANQGIGFGIVRRLCKEHPDWKVYGTARSKKNADEAVGKLKEEGFSNAKFLELDLTNEKTITEVKNYLVKEHQGLDVLVNNAGIAFKQRKSSRTRSKWSLPSSPTCLVLLPCVGDFFLYSAMEPEYGCACYCYCAVCPHVSCHSGCGCVVPRRSALHQMKQLIIKLLGVLYGLHCKHQSNMGVAGLGYQHLTVNHSRHFVHPVVGVHTNPIESAWSHVKRFLKKRGSNCGERLQLNLYCYMWLQWLGRRYPGGVFERLLFDVANAFLF